MLRAIGNLMTTWFVQTGKHDAAAEAIEVLDGMKTGELQSRLCPWEIEQLVVEKTKNLI